jgi:2-iminobutanoate/2-iminopropanoate deaminase
MSIQKIFSASAPQPIGPYSQAVQVDKLIFSSGQIALDPQSGNLVEGDAGTQTKQVIENLKTVLESAGSSLAKVVKTTIYLKNMDDFARVNEVYGSYFAQSMPARSTVEVARLPKDVFVEIDCIASLE